MDNANPYRRNGITVSTAAGSGIALRHGERNSIANELLAKLLCLCETLRLGSRACDMQDCENGHLCRSLSWAYQHTLTFRMLFWCGWGLLDRRVVELAGVCQAWMGGVPLKLGRHGQPTQIDHERLGSFEQPWTWELFRNAFPLRSKTTGRHGTCSLQLPA